eukprot:TRINITY_DN315_c0_g1_i1.p1 TRINITY_DN315_c0_g1~~TRINITY_DN315_c0_g1_i1.p1  ORF type:complete len:355 (-),score=62.26 TRINITY_DN315_c0_g1_i1:577-1587(-)
MADDGGAIVFKKRKANASRRREGDDDEGEGSMAIVRPQMALKDNPLLVSSAREKRGLDLAFQSTRTAAPAGPSDANATAINTLAEDEINAMKANEVDQAARQARSTADGLYRGMKGYRDYEPETGANKAATASGRAKGPMKAPLFIRQQIRVDFQGYFCKDYKETGFCGFGDSCKFVHDRGDYKTGWQLDQEWEAEEREKRRKLAEGTLYQNDSDNEHPPEPEDDLPFMCEICNGDFKAPVLTKCGHYFCEACALGRFAKKQTKCAVCGAQTNGIFTRAVKLIERLKERAAKEAAETNAAEDQHDVPIVQADDTLRASDTNATLSDDENANSDDDD